MRFYSNSRHLLANGPRKSFYFFSRPVIEKVMIMNATTEKKADRRFPRFQWAGEALVLAIVAPALVYSVLTISNLPIA